VTGLLSIAEVMERLPGASERRVRARIRELGCFYQIGNAMFMALGDFDRLLEDMRPPLVLGPR